MNELQIDSNQVKMGASLSEEEASLVRRFDPSRDDTIGFFVAKFVKEARH